MEQAISGLISGLKAGLPDAVDPATVAGGKLDYGREGEGMQAKNGKGEISDCCLVFVG